MVRYTNDNAEWNKNWKTRIEANYTHWTKDEPVNQIQLAFRNHWSLFNQFMESPHFNGGKRVLEVGCGRGSLSAYFSAAGYDCTLVDRSEEVIEIAKSIFSQNKLKGNFLVGDAYDMQLGNNTFDIVFSIGLFEHFEDIETPIKEQIRVLERGGLLIAYIVPEYKDNLQKKYEWINEILKGYNNDSDSETLAPKEEVYRSDRGSEEYIPVLKTAGLTEISSIGVYPVPMISHSTNFPFSLMPSKSEKALVKYLNKLLSANSAFDHQWMCEEGDGNAFVVWGYKS